MRILDKEASAIGMGCWAIGGPFFAGDQPLGWGEVDDGMSKRTIHAALDHGVTVFDTANVYGAGHSERILGDALKGRDDVLLVSKLGMAFDEETKQVSGHDANPENVLPAIEASLNRLNREQIDIMLLHINALPIEDAKPIFEEMEKARAQGKIGAFGWSTDFPDSAKAMAEMDGFIGIENAMNVFVDVPKLQKTIADHNLISFVRSPLAMGVLTGKYGENSTIPEDDVRSRDQTYNDYFRGRQVPSKHLKNLHAIRELVKSGGRTLAQGSLCWLMAKSSRNLPIPGAKNVAQITENADAMEHGPLPSNIMEEIENLIQREPEGPPQER